MLGARSDVNVTQPMDVATYLSLVRIEAICIAIEDQRQVALCESRIPPFGLSLKESSDPRFSCRVPGYGGNPGTSKPVEIVTKIFRRHTDCRQCLHPRVLPRVAF